MEKWQTWMKNEKILDKDFENYKRKKIIREGATITEVFGHISKAKRNLQFSRKVIDELKEFYEWPIVSYYYAVYQSALALCALKNYKTKKHLATIAILIKYFYPKHLSKEDLQMITNTMMEEEDIKELVELKNQREDATYSISIKYEKELVEKLGKKAISFVNKAERIINEKN